MMKKNFAIMGMAVIIGTTALSGCGFQDKQETVQTETEKEEVRISIPDDQSAESKDEINATEKDPTAEIQKTGNSTGESTDTSLDAQSAALFKELAACNFTFSSGAGAWSTELTVNEDGSFSGFYHDSDMGDSGDGYPDGTVYTCDFTGKFAPVEKVDEYTYKTKLEKLESKEKAGKEELADGMKYVYSTPYGLDDAVDIYIYVKGTPVSKLPEEYLEWVTFPLNGAKTLPFYGIFNETAGTGFYGYDETETNGSGITEDSETSEETGSMGTVQIESGSMDGLIDTLNQESAINERLQKEALTQDEMNQLSEELYKVWDAQLNTTWKQLKNTLDAATMETVTKQQREWIKERDKKIEEAGKDYEGGSLQPMIKSTEGAELTKTRVYELFDYLR